MKTNYVHPAILAVLRDGPGLFTDRSSYALPQAQRNLEGRTHYVDDATLKYFGSRVLSCGMTDDNSILYLIESCKTSYDGGGREFRFVVFDVFGTAVERAYLGKGFKNSEQARRAMWDWLNSFDAQAHYLEVLARRAACLEGEARVTRDALGVVAAERVEERE